MPELAAWQWMLGVLCAFMIGAAKTGVPGVGALMVPLMVLAVGDARHAAAWTAPVLITGDIFAVLYWRRHADVKKLFSLVPWVAIGMAAGAFALSLDEKLLRRIIGVTVALMLVLYIAQRRGALRGLSRGAGLYGVGAGFATTIANAAGPIMNMYLLTRRLSKEQFVATGAWFFFTVNLAKIPIYLWQDLLSAQSLAFDAAMIPAVLVGALAGLWILRRIPQTLFETIVVVLTAVTVLFLFR